MAIITLKSLSPSYSEFKETCLKDPIFKKELKAQNTLDTIVSVGYRRVNLLTVESKYPWNKNPQVFMEVPGSGIKKQLNDRRYLNAPIVLLSTMVHLRGDFPYNAVAAIRDLLFKRISVIIDINFELLEELIKHNFPLVLLYPNGISKEEWNKRCLLLKLEKNVKERVMENYDYYLERIDDIHAGTHVIFEDYQDDCPEIMTFTQ